MFLSIFCVYMFEYWWFYLYVVLHVSVFKNKFCMKKTILNVGSFPPFELLGGNFSKWALLDGNFSGWELYRVGTFPYTHMNSLKAISYFSNIRVKIF